MVPILDVGTPYLFLLHQAHRNPRPINSPAPPSNCPFRFQGCTKSSMMDEYHIHPFELACSWPLSSTYHGVQDGQPA